MLNNQHNLSWTGRSLTGATVGGVTYSFTYNDEGIRTGKISSSGKHTRYILDGSKIVAETTDTETIVYIYDETGSPIGVQYRLNSYAEDAWDTLWYEKNPRLEPALLKLSQPLQILGCGLDWSAML